MRTSSPACPRRPARAPSRASSRPPWRSGPPSARWSWRWRWSARRARREGISQVENAVYSDAEGAAAIANSRGFAASYRATQAWAYASAFAGEGEDLMTGLGIGLGRDPGELDAGGDRDGGRRTRAGAGGRPPAREPPLPGGAGRLRRRLVRRLHRLDAVRRRGAARAIAVRRARGRGGGGGRLRAGRRRPPSRRARIAPFDGEGSPTRRTPLIEEGRLAGYLYDARTARKDGRETTANAGRGSYRSPPSVGTTNLLVEPGGRRSRSSSPRRARGCT